MIIVSTFDQYLNSLSYPNATYWIWILKIAYSKNTSRKKFTSGPKQRIGDTSIHPYPKITSGIILPYTPNFDSHPYPRNALAYEVFKGNDNEWKRR